jgi:hypothetical protein
MPKLKQALNVNRIAGIAVFVGSFVLYVTTLAPSVVPGDPGEYQFIPHILGIAHPPGYAFFTILGKVWTSVVRVGTIAYRSNLLAAAAGAWTVLMAYGMVALLWKPRTRSTQPPDAGGNARIYPTIMPIIPPLFAAAALATTPDLWQHSIHANAHIVSAALSATALFSALRWWSSGQDRWLYIFAFLAALGVTHHPLLAFGAPAYVLFVLSVRPRILLDWRQLGMVGLAILLGLGVFLYLPLRAGATPFGPTPSLDALLGHATARGIRGNLFHFGLQDQFVRLRVFFELLLLQYSPLTLLVAGLGAAWLAWRRTRPFVLFAVFFVLNLVFIINTVQDVMAYLLLPFTTVAVFAGAGAIGALQESSAVQYRSRLIAVVVAGLCLILIAGPLASIPHTAPRITLRDYRLADEFIHAVRDQFSGTGQGAVLLAPWEALTSLYYAEQVEGRRLDPDDVVPVFVASGTANPWVENVWKHIDEGPIFLADYRPEVAAEGFRLRPIGDWPFYALEAPPALTEPTIVNRVDTWFGDAIQLIGWDIDRTGLEAGETANLTLYLTISTPQTDYLMPYLLLGDRMYRWTTDSRLNTPWWLPHEIIVERYPITVPFGTPPGDYELALGFSNLSAGTDLNLSDGTSTVSLPAALRVTSPNIAPPDDVLHRALANINSRIVLLGARASARGQTAVAPWSEAPRVQAGDSIQIWLDWQALTSLDAPYTVFVHLIDGAGRLWAQHDYTPMGGAFPTFLWIPRWFEGQRVSDPYKLTLPHDIPPGDYLIEVGMYGMTDHRRAYHFDPQGNLAGDRYVLGPVRVEEP